MYDLTGWTEVGCTDSDQLRSEHKVTVASSLTDPSGVYSSGVTFTEWWSNDLPLLRDYRYSDERNCQHYMAADTAAAIEDDQ